MIIVYTDGGSRGNPGEAALGVFITDAQGKKLAGFGRRLGITTNNVAEYQAVIDALDWLLSQRELIEKSSGITFRMDSKLVASQLAGLFKVKHPNMIPLFMEVKMRIGKLNKQVRYVHIPREQNKMADSFVNAALDNLL